MKAREVEDLKSRVAEQDRLVRDVYMALCKSERRQGELAGELKWLRPFAYKNLGFKQVEEAGGMGAGVGAALSEGRDTTPSSSDGHSGSENMATLSSQLAARINVLS